MSGRLSVLNLVTNPDARCFNHQVDGLADLGVDGEVLAPRGSHDVAGDTERHRSVVDYLRFYPTVLRRSFGAFDLLHANYGLTGPAAIGQPTLPVVLSLWGSDLFGRFGWLAKLSARRADATIVMSDAMAEELDQPCHVIPHGVDVEQFAPVSRSEARAELGWDPSTRYVLFPYPTVRDVKDYPRAERVVERARRRFQADVELQAVVGVPHDRMPWYMNAADVLLLTSRHEGSPNTVKEAMACNLPVVSTDVGDVRERLAGVEPSGVASTDAGLVDLVCTILERGERSDGRAAIRHLSVERTARRIRRVYEAVLDGADGPGGRPEARSRSGGRGGR